LGTSSEEPRSPLRPGDPEVCPYCGRRPTGVGADVYSDDHIFMEAIGGKLLKQFSSPKKFVLEGETLGMPARTQESSFNLDLDKMVGLTALKMAFAVATLAFPDEVSNFANARLDLADTDEKSRVRSVVFDHRVHHSLDASRDPLCHTIYLEEQGGVIHGIVQFFGGFQAYVTLSDKVSRSYKDGFLATLDPTTGEERFLEVPRLSIGRWTGNDSADQLSPIKKLNAYARQRGAKSDALDVSSVRSEDGVERKAKWSIPGVSWTGDIPGRSK